jgi:hypothetical protein
VARKEEVQRAEGEEWSEEEENGRREKVRRTQPINNIAYVFLQHRYIFF